MMEKLQEDNYNLTNEVFTLRLGLIASAVIFFIFLLIVIIFTYTCLSGNKKEYIIEDESSKQTVLDLSQKLTQELVEKTELQQKVAELEMKIPPDVPSSKSHQLVLVLVAEDGLKRCYKLVRRQEESLSRRLQEIQREYNITDLDEPGIVKTWNNIPHAVDTGFLVLDFLQKRELEVNGRKQLFYWEGSPKKLHHIIEAFVSKGSGGEKQAAEVYMSY